MPSDGAAAFVDRMMLSRADRGLSWASNRIVQARFKLLRGAEPLRGVAGLMEASSSRWKTCVSGWRSDRSPANGQDAQRAAFMTCSLIRTRAT